jgi:hypothetical protein
VRAAWVAITAAGAVLLGWAGVTRGEDGALAAAPIATRAPARWHAEVAGGLGLDNLGGIGSEGVVFGEVGGRFETHVLGPLLLGVSMSLRQDLTAYDYALAEWTPEHKPGVEAHAIVGTECERFLLTIGPRLYGEGRQGRSFRVGLSKSPFPFGEVHLRFGRRRGDNVELSLGDGTLFAATGGGALRLTRGLVAFERQYSVGGYLNPLERAAGAVLVRDGQPSADGTAYRLGLLLGTDTTFALARWEASVTIGRVWH